jgi:hypothetical protein
MGRSGLTSNSRLTPCLPELALLVQVHVVSIFTDNL